MNLRRPKGMNFEKYRNLQCDASYFRRLYQQGKTLWVGKFMGPYIKTVHGKIGTPSENEKGITT